MSSTQPSLFSTLKVFRFTSSRPPPPPPKDPNYLYSQSNNPSVASLSQNQSRPPSNSPKAASLSPKYNANGNGARSVRSLSPTPTRAAQFPQQLQQQLLQPQPHLLEPSPPAYSSASTSSQDPNSGAGKRGFFRKVSSLRKRSTSKNLRPTTAVEEPTNDESISRPWNFQHHIHIDEAFQGIPPSWSSSLANLGYSDAEIALIMQGRRNRARTPDPSSVQDPPSSMTPSRSHSPTSINPRARSSSLRRQRSDGSISRSERSLRLGPPAPPPALPLPPPPQTASSPIDGSGAPAAPPPTPASGGSALCDTIESDSAETPSEAQYVYVHHQRQTPNGLMAMPPPAPVPVIQPVPVRPLLHSRNNSSSSTNKPLSRSSSARSARERPFKTQFPSPAPFRVVNTTSPPPRYSDDVVRGGSPPSITSDAVWPRSKAKADRSSLSRPSHRDQINTPSPDSSRGTEALRSASPAIAEGVGRGSKELHVVQEGQDYDSDHSSSERLRSRPSLLSILPPRVSLRKDVLEDLSSWSASLFSSLPSELHDSPGSSHVTATTSIATTLSSKSEIRKHGSKPSVTLPTIILHSEVLEENEDEGDEGDDLIEHDYSHTASPLYHELMGMMQGRAGAANGVSSADSGSPASASFQFEPASSSSHGATSRDSQLTIRFDPGRDGSRDSSASMSTLTHATIVRGASIVRRVRADVVTTSPTIATLKGKEPEHGRAPIQIVQEDAVDDNNDDDEEGDSSSDATGSDGDRSSRSPVDTLAFTSGPNSLEDTRSYKCPRQTRGHGSPLPSPAPSPLRASFSEQGGDGNAQSCETQDVSTQGPYVTPPPSAPPVPVRWSPIATPTTNSGGLDDVSSLPLSPALTEPVKEDEKSPVPPRFTSTGVRKPRYPSWLAALVLPLSEFIDDVADPRVLFT
ncbi:hypothetical protein F5148DRAFT_447587 [Russula earlei]|uniref:Uncharacterized protein n=1 Tax=Russula earlei TaxID=71964 RepID=A0ACC0TYQ2_9AGAM|nr:hypothetical protein F5148DRAFT_447587 [Russula earlei]